MQSHDTTRRWVFLGARVADLRKRNDMSQSELARLLDVHPITISRIERGVVHPRHELLANMAVALRTTPAFLEYGVEGGRNG